MGSVRQAVLEFDAAVQVPWRPLLASGDVGRAARPARAARPPARTALPGSGPRVAGHLRPVADRPATPERRATGPAAEVTRTRRDPARPGGRPVPTGPAAGAVRGGCTAAPASVRLTRRGRRLVTALALGGAVALGSLIPPLLDGGDGGLRLAGGSSVVVEPGDTVWSIAGEVAGDERDVRVVVDAIEELNDLEGSVVVPGQVLHLP
ncbi:LysM peptidoglycan-binding domain-containing protein [Geodermatophilus sp. SYSU D01176]